MAITGKRVIEEIIIPAREVIEKVCDICGADATEKTTCRRCKRDLCADHQIEANRLVSGQYIENKELTGIYCKECLIAEITERF